jgi:hypothetical protein
VARIDDLLQTALRSLPEKPVDPVEKPDAATQSDKPQRPNQDVRRRYSEQVSEVVALAVATELRLRGLKGARPASPGELGGSGAERRMAGGLGAKKVDITWATEEAGLLLAISIKSINFADRKTRNYQKNLVNRRGDMLMEAVTLHRRFPYAVLGAFFFFDKGAGLDNTKRRKSTFENAHARLKLFTGRNDPAGRDEQFERFYIFLIDANPKAAEIQAYEVGKPDKPVSLDEIMKELLSITAERNPDFYELDGDNLRPVT